MSKYIRTLMSSRSRDSATMNLARTGCPSVDKIPKWESILAIACTKVIDEIQVNVAWASALIMLSAWVGKVHDLHSCRLNDLATRHIITSVVDFLDSSTSERSTKIATWSVCELVINDACAYLHSFISSPSIHNQQPESAISATNWAGSDTLMKWPIDGSGVQNGRRTAFGDFLSSRQYAAYFREGWKLSLDSQKCQPTTILFRHKPSMYKD